MHWTTKKKLYKLALQNDKYIQQTTRASFSTSSGLLALAGAWGPRGPMAAVKAAAASEARRTDCCDGVILILAKDISIYNDNKWHDTALNKHYRLLP